MNEHPYLGREGVREKLEVAGLLGDKKNFVQYFFFTVLLSVTCPDGGSAAFQ